MQNEDQFWRNAGFGAVLDKAAAGNQRAQAAMARIKPRAVAEKPSTQWLGPDADLLN